MIPSRPEFRELFTKIWSAAEPRLQIACLHGIQRYAHLNCRSSPQNREQIGKQWVPENARSNGHTPHTQ
jgi:hypothetical protein